MKRYSAKVLNLSSDELLKHLIQDEALKQHIIQALNPIIDQTATAAPSDIARDPL